MTNLFNIFDPSTSLYNIQLNWINTLLTLIIMPNFIWILPNRINLAMMFILNNLNKEMLMLFNKKKIKSPTFIFMNLFMFIFLNNFISLFPYIFSSSSHLTFSLTLAIPFWLFFIIMSMIKNMKKFIIHLIPLNTPMILTPIMTIIETTSIFIRPISLSIRLTANLIAGHLLMSLLNFNSLMMIVIIMQMFLMFFELCVALIQSYVFSILTTLYSND
uniref:ATP synthase subunit a n=1 Tax=Colophina clematis TaxID=133073 RepID=A0A096VK93_9HEMI|nr:ATP synthase F0 subunit 6 [Colophina clematis]